MLRRHWLQQPCHLIFPLGTPCRQSTVWNQGLRFARTRNTASVSISGLALTGMCKKNDGGAPTSTENPFPVRLGRLTFIPESEWKSLRLSVLPSALLVDRLVCRGTELSSEEGSHLSRIEANMLIPT